MMETAGDIAVSKEPTAVAVALRLHRLGQPIMKL
jgi:hypothetical protein